MLRPAVQPGSKIDYELARREGDARRSSRPADVDVRTAPDEVDHVDRRGRHATSLHVRRRSRTNRSRSKSRLTRPAATPVASRSRGHTDEDKRPRPLPLHRVLLPWADTEGRRSASRSSIARPTELEGGSWARGRKVFFSEQAACCEVPRGPRPGRRPSARTCRTSSTATTPRCCATSRSRASPSTPTTSRYVVHLKDGRTLHRRRPHRRRQAARRRQGRQDDRSSTRPTSSEMQPVGRLDHAGGAAEAARPGADARPDDVPADARRRRCRATTPARARPKPRTVAEVNAVLAGAPNPPAKTRPIRVVLVAGPKDHGPGEHDYPAWQKAWAELLAAGRQRRGRRPPGSGRRRRSSRRPT